MSYDNSQMQQIHLISLPSVWLSPTASEKILCLSSRKEFVEKHLVAELDCPGNALDWSIYWIEDLDLNNQEHLDWILINHSHCDHTIVEIVDWQDLSLALALDAHAVMPSHNHNIAKLAQFGYKQCVSLGKCVDLIKQKASR